MNYNITVNLPILSILGIGFIILKLTGIITWSWWWVTAPLWIPIAFVAGTVFAICIVALIGLKR